GALEVLKPDRAEASTVQLYDEMLAELKRVNGILQRLLESGRPAPLRISKTDLALLVKETVDLARPGLGRRKVEVVARVEEGLPEIPCDAAKIRQVLLNLVQNAGEAMGEKGGRVTVRAGVLPRGGAVVLAVEDDGPGISSADQTRLFEPFFTTKFTGTGLGLTISKSLVEQHGGRLEVESIPGTGTTFYVFLPEGGPPAAAAAGEAS
ncbi:MAG TPA: ATP-binding protein, partial [Thermoanaerobaculia bacterium]|nr:ATP-binding protein [Thermoanaerobaculia bacterium]